MIKSIKFHLFLGSIILIIALFTEQLYVTKILLLMLACVNIGSAYVKFYKNNLHWEKTNSFAVKFSKSFILTIILLFLANTFKIYDTSSIIENYFILLAFFISLLNLTINSSVIENKFIGSKFFTVFIYAILTIAIVISVSVKLPYIGYDFTGKHTMKYNAYVEPALSMIENDTPFYNQKRYYSHPIDSPEGIYREFGNLPMLEWLLYTTYSILPDTPVEIATRVLMFLLGILSIIMTFVYSRQFTDKITSLTISILVANGSIFQFSSYVTVNDTLLFLISLVSLYLFEKFIDKSEKILLYTAGIILGVGAAVKLSILLWMIPAIIIRILIENKFNFAERIYMGLLFFANAFFVLASFKLTLKNLPESSSTSIAIFIIELITWFIIINKIQAHQKLIEQKINFFVSKKHLIALSLIAIFPLTFFLIHILNIAIFLGESFTDSKLILNLNVYSYIAYEQIRLYISDQIFFILPLLAIMLITPRFLSQNENKMIVPIAAGSLLYLILASKSIFFHNYYALIIIFSIYILVAIFATRIAQNFGRIGIYLAPIFVFLIVIQTNHSETIALLSPQKQGYREACEYLRQNTKSNESYIDESFLYSLTICAKRPSVGSFNFLEHPEFKSDVASYGLYETFKKYNISYIITSNNYVNFENYANLFPNEGLDQAIYRRSDSILSVVENKPFFYDLDERIAIIKKYNLDQAFVLEKTFGQYNFYKVKKDW